MNDERRLGGAPHPTTTRSSGSLAGPSPPAVLIRVELEAAPVVVVDVLTDAELARLADWIHSHPRLAALVTAAVELEAEARAA